MFFEWAGLAERRFAFRASAALAAFLAAAAATAYAAGAPEEAARFLAEARKKYADPCGQDLKSFSAEVALRSSPDPRVSAVKEKIKFAWSWSAPDREDFAMLDVPETLHKQIRQVCQGMWREALVAPVLDQIAAGEKLEASESDREMAVSGRHPELKRFRAVFEKESRKLLRIEIEDRAAELRFGFREEKGLFRLEWKEALAGGVRVLKRSWESPKPVNSWVLPSILSVESREGQPTSFNVLYVTVNGKPAVMGEQDPEEIRKAVDEFRKGWPSWDDLEKISRMKTLAKTDHDLASAAIAALGLADREPIVRKQAAQSLGEMGRKNVVPQMIAAMDQNEGFIETYVVLIRALGMIGDPRAIPVLSKDWWNQKGSESGYAAARAKIDALGDIRDKRSVDAIIDLFFIAPDEGLGPLADNIVNSLKKLTGQDFSRNRRAWKDWWKKNRDSYK